MREATQKDMFEAMENIAIELKNYNSYMDERNGILVMIKDAFCSMADSLEMVAKKIESENGFSDSTWELLMGGRNV